MIDRFPLAVVNVAVARAFRTALRADQTSDSTFPAYFQRPLGLNGRFSLGDRAGQYFAKQNVATFVVEMRESVETRQALEDGSHGIHTT